METADPTTMKAGTGREMVVRPEPSPQQIQAYEHSPTLMAGEVAGMQGSVRVWSPRRRTLLGTAIGLSLTSIIFLIAALASHNPAFLLFMLPPAAFVLLLAALERPRLIATDDAGIGITTRKGSRALRWEEIQTARGIISSNSDNSSARIYLQAPESVEINLFGYPASVQAELMDTITRCARLQPHPKDQKLFLNPAAPQKLGTLGIIPALTGPGDQDIRDELAAGRKIGAIKLYRERYGVGLKEAKDVIDSLEQNGAQENDGSRR